MQIFNYTEEQDMQAALLNKIQPMKDSTLKLLDLPDPEPGPGEVRLRVSCCAVCRTDLHVIEGDLPVKKLPLIPGHQIVGRIDKLGPGAGPLKIGQRVGVPWLRHTCGGCEFCEGGRENLCESSRFTGYHADGGYAEYTVAPEEFVYEIPDAFEDVDAAPLLCAGIIGYRALKRCDLKRGGRLAIYGFGSSAHVVMQIALHRGCDVYVVSRGEKHRELALSMGASWAGVAAEDMPDKTESAVIFAPVGHLVPPALKMLRKGGALALAGIYMTDIPAMEYEQTIFYERDIRSVTANTRQDGRELLAEAAQIPIRPHVTTYPLHEANQALCDLKADRVNGTGVLVTGT